LLDDSDLAERGGIDLYKTRVSKGAGLPFNLTPSISIEVSGEVEQRTSPPKVTHQGLAMGNPCGRFADCPPGEELADSMPLPSTWPEGPATIPSEQPPSVIPMDAMAKYAANL